MNSTQPAYPLSYCISLYGGGTPSKDIPEYWDGEIPWASVKDLKTTSLNTTQDSITALGLANSSSKIVKAGSIIIATRMAVGRVAIAELDVAINQDLKAVVCSDKVHVKYLFYFLFSQENNFNKVASGATVKGIKINHIMDMRIPLPPLAEQQKIAAILDAADSLRQKDRQLIEKYTALSQSLFLEMFGDPVTNPMGWEIKDLDDVSNKITDGTHQSPKFISSGIPFLLVSNIVNNQITYKTNKFISEEEYEQLTKNTPIELGDILYTSVGSYGNPAIVESKTKFCFQRHIAQIKLNHQLVNARYIREMLLTDFVKKQADSLARGVAQKTLNLKVIKSLKIMTPPITLQNQFAERIQLIEHQKQQAQASLEKSEDLFNSLLQRAFTGELTKHLAA